MRKSVFIAIALFLSVALGEPPWSVDDPWTTDYESVIVYLNYYTEHSVDSTDMSYVPNVAATWGITQYTEFGLSIPTIQSESVEEPLLVGIGDIAASVKHRFWENEEKTAFTVSGQILVPPDNKESLNGGTVSGSTALMGQFLFRSSWKLVSYGAYAKPFRNVEGSIYYGSVLTNQVSETLALGGQLIASKDFFTETSGLFAGPGFALQLSDRIATQGQISRGISGPIDWIVYFGFTASFSVARKKTESLLFPKSKLSAPDLRQSSVN